ncbi:MAG: LytTR family DNA-binding domain-containing protein [Spirosomataceae bacterium]
MERIFSLTQDWTARLIAVPLAALVASHVVFAKQFPWQAAYHFPTPYFLTVVTVMLSCWEVNVRLFLWMDGRLPFQVNPKRRIGQQVLLNGTATLLTFLSVFPMAQRLYLGRWPSVSLLMTGAVVCAAIATIVNGTFIALYLMRTIYWEKSHKTAIAEEQEKKRTSSPPVLPLIRVETSSGQLILKPEEIAYFYSTGGIVLLVKTDGTKLTTRYQSLHSLTEKLPDDYFFSLSRQITAGLGAVKAVREETNRKLTVSLTPALHQQEVTEQVVVSRYRSAEFRKWLSAAATV